MNNKQLSYSLEDIEKQRQTSKRNKTRNIFIVVGSLIVLGGLIGFKVWDLYSDGATSIRFENGSITKYYGNPTQNNNSNNTSSTSQNTNSVSVSSNKPIQTKQNITLETNRPNERVNEIEAKLTHTEKAFDELLRNYSKVENDLYGDENANEMQLHFILGQMQSLCSNLIEYRDNNKQDFNQALTNECESLLRKMDNKMGACEFKLKSVIH